MNKELNKLLNDITGNKKLSSILNFYRVEDSNNIYINMDNLSLDITIENNKSIWVSVALFDSVDLYEFKTMKALYKYIKLVYKEYLK